MATITSRVCDIDPKHKEAEPVVFGMGGEYFSADLCTEDTDKLTAALEPYVKVGTPLSAKDALKGGNGAGNFDPAVVRAWAQRKGKPVNDRGRVPADLVTEWRADTGN